jgi:hypothetical protein
MKTKKAKAFLLLMFMGLGLSGHSAEPQTRPDGVVVGDQEEQAAFEAAKTRWEGESAKLKSAGKPERGHHDSSLLTEYVKRWPAGEFADQAALMLIEDSFCATWADYPDCGLLEVKGYEELLTHYPGTALKDEIELKRAQAYYEMARLWLSGSGQHSDNMSDLARGQSLEIALELKTSKNPEIQKSAGELEQKLATDFTRPIAPIPSGVLQKDYN